MLGNNPISSNPISSIGTTSSTGITANLAVTLDSIAFDATANHGRSAVLNATLDSIQVAMSGIVGHDASMAVTLDSIAFSANANIGHPAIMDVTLESVNVLMNAINGHSATMAVTLNSIDVLINATDGHLATMAVTLDSIDVSMSATENHVFVVDTHDGEGLKKKFQKEAQDKAKYRKRVIDLYEELVELKPKAAEEIIAPFADENAQKQSGLDFNALLGNLDRTEALYNSLKRELEEIDDEEVFLLL